MNNYHHGQFCWIELTANNWQQAKNFYCNLFGWHAVDESIGDGMYYTMMQLDGKTVAAMFQMTPEQVEQGVKTHWLSYIAVDDANESTELAKTLGAQIIAGPHDVMKAGRMSIINEPNGAVFAIWQGIEAPGVELRDVDNAMCWNELATSDETASRDFYQQLLQWQYIDSDMPEMKYTECVAGEVPQGGMMEMDEQWGDTPPHWMPYFQVDDCERAVEKAQALGATICVPVTEIPNVGHFSVINDVQGATFSVITLSHGHKKAEG